MQFIHTVSQNITDQNTQGMAKEKSNIGANGD